MTTENGTLDPRAAKLLAMRGKAPRPEPEPEPDGEPEPPARKQRVNVTPELKARIAGLRASGASVAAVAVETGLAESTVCRWSGRGRGPGPETARHAVSGPRPKAGAGTGAADWSRLTNAEACQRILELLRTGRGGRLTRESGG